MLVKSLKNLKSLSEFADLFDEKEVITLVSPLDSYSIENRQFRRKRTTFFQFWKKDDKVFVKETSHYSNVDSFLEEHGRELIDGRVDSSYRQVEFSKYAKTLTYLMNKKVKVYSGREKTIFDPKDTIKEDYNLIKTKYSELVKMFESFRDVSSTTKDSKGNFKYKSYDNTHILRNQSSGSDVFYWMIDKNKFEIGGTHAFLTDNRIKSEENRWNDGMSSSLLYWSNNYHENGYNRNFSIAKAGVKSVRKFHESVIELEKLSNDLNLKVKNIVKNWINNG